MGESISVVGKPRRGDRNIGRSAGSLSPADAGLIVNQHGHPTAFAVGHNISALRACESSSEKNFADSGRLRLTPVGRMTRVEMSGKPHFREVSPSGILFFLRGDSRPCATAEDGEETVRSSC